MKLVVMLQIDTDDPLIVDPDRALGSVDGAKRLREAVLEALPHAVERLIALMPVDEAQLMTETHEAAKAAAGWPAARRPPKGYRPPSQA